MDALWAIVLIAAGALLDVLRSVFIPASTEWINRLLPFKRQQQNRQENLSVLEAMEKLKSLGQDPQLATYLHESTEAFAKRIQYQKEAFIATEAEMLDGAQMTQLGMNLEADRRAQISDLQMDGILMALLMSDRLDDKEKDALKVAQEAWTEFRRTQAEFSAAQHEGGSMRPLAYSNAYEALTIERISHLKSTYEEVRELRGPV